jgi:hypothetical protein
MKLSTEEEGETVAARLRIISLFHSHGFLFRTSNFELRAFLSLVVAFAFSLSARADLILRQRVEGGGQTGEQTIRIKDGRSRADLAATLSLITDAATGDAYTLKHADRTFMKVPATQSQAMLAEMKKKRGDAAPPQLKPTGKKEKVGEYECEIFTADLGELKVTYWLAKDFPNYAGIQQQLSAVQSGPLALASQGLMPDPATFPGMTMKTVLELGGKKVTTTTLSVQETPIAASVFDIPAGYRETPSPELQFTP